MNTEPNKRMSLKEAIARFVPDGAHLSIGGFTINRNPMAAVYEINRQQKRRLHLYAHSNGQGVDELIGAGCVDAIEIAYAGSGRFAPTCIRFRKAVESGCLKVEDYSNYQMTLRFMAGAMGVPFLPTRSSLGSDIVTRWGFSKSQRQAEPLIPDLGEIAVIENRTGLVMLPMRDTAQGTHFHLGEVLMSEARISSDGDEAFGMRRGRDLEAAMAMAIVDACVSLGREVPRCAEFVATEARHLEADDLETLCRVEATRVNMETF
jgi:phosphonate C-P lyase system protein PhnG